MHKRIGVFMDILDSSRDNPYILQKGDRVQMDDWAELTQEEKVERISREEAARAEAAALEMQKKQRRTKVLRCIAGILVFIVSYLFASAIIGIVLKLFQYITPRAYQSSELWLTVLAFISGAVATSELVSAVGDNEKLTFILMIVASAITLILIGGELVIGFETIKYAAGLIAYGITYIVLAVKLGRYL